MEFHNVLLNGGALNFGGLHEINSNMPILLNIYGGTCLNSSSFFLIFPYIFQCRLSVKGYCINCRKRFPEIFYDCVVRTKCLESCHTWSRFNWRHWLPVLGEPKFSLGSPILIYRLSAVFACFAWFRGEHNLPLNSGEYRYEGLCGLDFIVKFMSYILPNYFSVLCSKLSSRPRSDNRAALNSRFLLLPTGWDWFMGICSRLLAFQWISTVFKKNVTSYKLLPSKDRPELEGVEVVWLFSLLDWFFNIGSFNRWLCHSSQSRSPYFFTCV